MGEVTALVLVEVVAVEQVDRHFGVAQDARVAGDAVGLDRPGQGVNLLVGRDGVVVVAELRGENLALVAVLHVYGVVPVGDAFLLVDGPQVVAQVLRAPLCRLQVAVVASQLVGGGEAVDHAGYRVGFLAGALDLLPFQGQVGTILLKIDHAIRELGLEVKFTQRADLLNPPVLRLEPKLGVAAPDEDDVFDFKGELPVLGIEGAVGKDEAAGGQQRLHRGAGVRPGITQVAHHLGIGRVRQLNLELAAVDGLDSVHAILDRRADVPTDQIGKGKAQLVHALQIPPALLSSDGITLAATLLGHENCDAMGFHAIGRTNDRFLLPYLRCIVW